jgi:hypothetical protein
MKHFNPFSILLILSIFLLAPTLAAAAFSPEAFEVPYQINNSDRIVIGTVSGIDKYNDNMDNTVAVKEWLYNPLPIKTIIVKTDSGNPDDAQFTQNESVLLMLKDQRPDKGVFLMSLGSAGKHSVSDRGTVIETLKAQGKWKGDQTVKTNDTDRKAENTVTVDKQEGESNTQKSNNTPFISPIWVLAVVLGVVVYVKKMK